MSLQFPLYSFVVCAPFLSLYACKLALCSFFICLYFTDVLNVISFHLILLLHFLVLYIEEQKTSCKLYLFLVLMFL